MSRLRSYSTRSTSFSKRQIKLEKLVLAQHELIAKLGLVAKGHQVAIQAIGALASITVEEIEIPPPIPPPILN